MFSLISFQLKLSSFLGFGEAKSGCDLRPWLSFMHKCLDSGDWTVLLQGCGDFDVVLLCFYYGFTMVLLCFYDVFTMFLLCSTIFYH